MNKQKGFSVIELSLVIGVIAFIGSAMIFLGNCLQTIKTQDNQKNQISEPINNNAIDNEPIKVDSKYVVIECHEGLKYIIGGDSIKHKMLFNAAGGQFEVSCNDTQEKENTEPQITKIKNIDVQANPYKENKEGKYE